MNQRGAYAKLLKHTCSIYRSSVTTNSSYEKVRGPETLLEANVPCFSSFPTGRKVVLPVGIDPSKLRLFYFEYDQDVRELDIIVRDGRRFIVNSVDSAGLINHHLEAMCETMQGG